MGDDTNSARRFIVICNSVALCVSTSHQKGAIDSMSGGGQFFKEDPHRPGQPLEIETKNKAGTVVEKIRTSIHGNFLL